MFSLFQRKRPPVVEVPTPTPAPVPKGFLVPESAASLLSKPRRQRLLEQLWQRTSVSRTQFATLYLAPIERYAEFVQQFPASESHHHAYSGGMLDHGLEAVVYALKLRQAHLLPAGASPETQAAQSEAWTAGVAYATLLHDIGKIAVDLIIEQADGTLWHPWHGPLQQPYRFRYQKARNYRLHSAASGLLASRLFNAELFDWLCGYPDLWSAFLYVMAGQYDQAGLLGELVIQADQASVAQALGGDPGKALAAPQHALQKKLLDGLRYLLREELKLNQPQASDGWLTTEALWLVSKTVSDKLRAHLLAHGIEGIPSSNTVLFNVLQDHGMALATPEGKAIWKATVASDAGWSHTFTLLKLSPALIWDSGERPEPFAGSVSVDHEEQAQEEDRPMPEQAVTESRQDDETENAGEFLEVPWTPDTPEDEGIEEIPVSPPTPAKLDTTPSGEHFMAWLRQRIQTHVLVINEARALVHTVDGTVYLVSPGLFQRYAQEHPRTALLAKQDQVLDWQWIQKKFEKLGLHRKQPDGLNIWTCEVTGPRKSRRVHGYLLEKPESLFNEAPPNNPYLNLLEHDK